VKVKHLLAIYSLNLGNPSGMIYWMLFKGWPRIETYHLGSEGNVTEISPYAHGHPELQRDPNERLVCYSIDAIMYAESEVSEWKTH